MVCHAQVWRGRVVFASTSSNTCRIGRTHFPSSVSPADIAAALTKLDASAC